MLICVYEFRALLAAVNEGGFKVLNELSENESLGFLGVGLPVDKAMARFQFLCEFF